MLSNWRKNVPPADQRTIGGITEKDPKTKWGRTDPDTPKLARFLIDLWNISSVSAAQMKQLSDAVVSASETFPSPIELHETWGLVFEEYLTWLKQWLEEKNITRSFSQFIRHVRAYDHRNKGWFDWHAKRTKQPYVVSGIGVDNIEELLK